MIETSPAKESVRRYFDREAADYLDAYGDQRTGQVRHDAFVERRALVLELTPRPARRILDIGAGPGVFTPHLLARGATCSVVDRSFEMVAAAKREIAAASAASGPATSFMVADIDRLPFAAGSFDAALCVGVLQYLPSIDAALGELARVVAPGGHVIVTFPNARSPLNLVHRAAVALARPATAVGRRLGVARDADPSRLTFRRDIPNRWMSASQIERRAHAAGLRVEQTIYHLLQFPFRVPGMSAAVDGWDRLVRGRAPRGSLAVLGREGIMRLVRE